MAPNVLESMGLMDIIVQPLRVQLATTNTAIVQQAYFLNTEYLQYSQEKSNADIRADEIDVNLFNAEQQNIILQHNLRYENIKGAILSILDSDNTFTFCNPLNASQVEIDYNNYTCHYTTIEARVYTDFHPDDFEVSLTLVFNVYVRAFRDATLVTVYCIAGFIGFLLLLEILLAGVRELLKRLDAVKINRKRWYVEMEHEKDPDDEEFQNKEQRLITKMLKACERHYGEEVTIRFRKILDTIARVKVQFQYSTPSELFLEIEKSASSFSPQPRVDESRFARMRNGFIRKFSAASDLGTEMSSRTEADEGAGLEREASETKLLKDKIYTLNMVALQAEEFFQWAHHEFGEVPGLDESSMRDKIQTIRALPHHIAIAHNLDLLQGLILQLLDQFRTPRFPRKSQFADPITQE